MNKYIITNNDYDIKIYLWTEYNIQELMLLLRQCGKLPTAIYFIDTKEVNKIITKIIKIFLKKTKLIEDIIEGKSHYLTRATKIER